MESPQYAWYGTLGSGDSAWGEILIKPKEGTEPDETTIYIDIADALFNRISVKVEIDELQHPFPTTVGYFVVPYYQGLMADKKEEILTALVGDIEIPDRERCEARLVRTKEQNGIKPAFWMVRTTKGSFATKIQDRVNTEEVTVQGHRLTLVQNQPISNRNSIVCVCTCRYVWPHFYLM